MTSRERLLAVLNGTMPDRVPVAPFVQEEYLSWYYPHKASVDRVADATELAEELDFDLMAKHRRFEKPHFFKKSFPGWELRQTQSSSDGIRHVRLEIVTPRRTLSQEEALPESGVATAGVHAATRKHLLETREDIEAFMEYLPPVDDATAREMCETAHAWRSLIGERGVLAPWGWMGVFNFTAELRGIESLLVDPFDDGDLYRAMMDRVASAMAEYNTRLGETEVECIGIQGHMANSNTVSPDYYRTWIQPHEKKVIDAVHAAGTFTVWHNCGYARTLYDNYRDLGMTVWETVSEPPRGDNRLAEAKAALGKDLVLLGNLDQVDFLKRAAPAEVADVARRIVETGKPGGKYIFSTSDFLERNTPRDNVVAMIGAAKEAGVY